MEHILDILKERGFLAQRTLRELSSEVRESSACDSAEAWSCVFTLPPGIMSLVQEMARRAATIVYTLFFITIPFYSKYPSSFIFSLTRMAIA